MMSVPNTAQASPSPETHAAPTASRAALEKASARLSRGADAAGTLDALYLGRAASDAEAAPIAARRPAPASKGLLRRADGYPFERLDLGEARTAEIGLPGGRSLTVELAVTEAELKRGMSHREAVPRDGLLFVMAAQDDYAYFHKNVLVPVDYVFIGEDGKVVSVAAGAAPAPPGTPWRSLRMLEGTAHRFALILPAGASKGLMPGAQLDGVAALAAVVEAVGPGAPWTLLTSADPRAPERLHSLLMERADGEDALSAALAQARALPRSGTQAEAVRKNLLALLTGSLRGRSLREQAVRGLIAGYFPEVWRRSQRPENPGWDVPVGLADLFSLPSAWHEDLHTLAHEAGHYAVGWLLGARPESLHVWGSGGGVTTFGAMPASAWKRVLISLAGPAAETVLSLLLLLGTALVWTWSLPALAGALHYGAISQLLGMPSTWAVLSSGLLAAGTLLHVQASPDGWRHDLIAAAWDLGWKRLAGELGWRMDRLQDADAPKSSFFSMLRQTLLPHALNRQARWDSPPPRTPPQT